MISSQSITPPNEPPIESSWLKPSLFAAFSAMLLITISGFFFGFPCRWLAQHGQWEFAVVSGLLFLVSFCSLIYLNGSDPGILHRGSLEEDPNIQYIARVNNMAFRLQWCSKCSFHRPPQTHHCPFCNICVEDFDHHCLWVNNCVGQRNFRVFVLLVVSLCLYLVVLLATILLFLIRTRHMPWSLDSAMAITVAVPVLVLLLPVILLLMVQAVSVSKGKSFWNNNPFDQGCANNWYLTICMPLGPKYMSAAIWMQQEEGTEWDPEQGNPVHTQFSPQHSRQHCPTELPGPTSPTHRQGPPGSGEAAALQEVRNSGYALGEGCLWVAHVLGEAPEVRLALKLKHMELKEWNYGPECAGSRFQSTPRCC
ncbi:palmitoyltransferase ZDHHC19-like [Marmota marmota marmota]|uniref:palmitoyltransferase ZDHHC19-like n=1 Tax=Marmota marmota marmota TaxID=9994 RepID=UPI002092492D|nr:palmitoyltransferase ZDHHC19-like [Marmota marmota marmota]